MRNEIERSEAVGNEADFDQNRVTTRQKEVTPGTRGTIRKIARSKSVPWRTGGCPGSRSTRH